MTGRTIGKYRIGDQIGRGMGTVESGTVPCRSDEGLTMPIQYERDDDARRIVITAIGEVTFDEVLAVLDRQVGDGAWSYSVLYDARAGVNEPPLEDVRRLVLHVGRLTTERGPRGPVALVTSNPRMFKMGRAYGDLGELTALNFQVFKTVEEAEQWLAEAH
jgi:hypothetical protein